MLRYMTAGESHGKGEMAILDGVPAGLKLDESFINAELSRRKKGYGRGKRMDIEADKIEMVSGFRKGMTIGSPVGLMVHNADHKINELPNIKNPRPGHADLAGIQKYGAKDARDILERASARETVMRVAAGAVAKLILKDLGIRVMSHVIRIGTVEAEESKKGFDDIFKAAESSQVRCADSAASEKMCKEIDKAAEAGDTLGGVIEVIIEGVPPGLGSYSQWDKRLDGIIAKAAVAIPAVKAVSIGNGIECAAKKGSQTHDPIGYDAKQKTFTRDSNNAGGLEGGVTNGSDIIVKIYMKPIATLVDPLRSVNIDTKKQESGAVERADVTAVPACGVIAEAVLALEIASLLLEKCGGDSMTEIHRNYDGYMESLKKI